MKPLLVTLIVTLGGLFAKSQSLLEKNITPNTELFGTINNETKLKLIIKTIQLTNTKTENYNVTGYSDVEGNVANFNGTISLNPKKTKELKDASFQIYDFKFEEEGTGKHSGILSGDIITKEFPSIFTLIGFEGNWENYDKSLNYKIYADNSHKLLKQ